MKALLLAVLFFASCTQESPQRNVRKEVVRFRTSDSIPNRLDKYFTHADAEKILGEPVHSTDSNVSRGNKVLIYKRTYSANDTDVVSNKLGALYVMLEGYVWVDSAKSRYSFVIEANRPHGIEELTGVGDEAYFHSDGTNFLFIMARRGGILLTMKVNKITSKTSREAFMLVAKRIVGDM